MQFSAKGIVDDWLSKNAKSPIFIGEYHPDPIAAELVKSVILELHGRGMGPIGLYLEGLIPSVKLEPGKAMRYSDVKRKLRLNKDYAYHWNTVKYDTLVKSVAKYCTIYGIDNKEHNGRRGIREELWRKQILDGQESIKVVFCGTPHIDYYDGVVARMGYDKETAFTVATIDRAPINVLRETGRLPKLSPFSKYRSVRKIYTVAEEKIPIGDWVLLIPLANRA